MAVSLTKGQQISLTKTSATPLRAVRMGLGWEGVKKKGFLGMGGSQVQVDLDANALLFDAAGTLVDVVWFRALRSQDGSVTHSGDNRTGAGAGDDETITVDLTRLPQNVVTVVFSVNNYSGHSFADIAEAYCRVINVDGDVEMARYNLVGAGGGHAAMIMASLKRSGSDWTMTAIGQSSQGRTYQDNLSDIRPHL
ncbi:TerD family protein [Deinococcus yunweiensis]|uniref:TerD family protein n=1 Tax=Deinococcus yunweiensis TaxID=367282 RepID=UPI00398EEE9F